MNNGFRSLYEGEPPAGDAGGDRQSPLGTPPGAAGGAPAALPEGAIYSDHRFVERLPDDLKADPIIGKYSKGGIEGLARSLVASQRMIGKDPNKLVELPDTVDQKFVTSLAGRLGLPADVKNYKLEGVKDAPAWTAPTTPFAQAMVSSAHKHGILPSQFQGFFNDVVPLLAGAEKEQSSALAKQETDNLAALDREWGQAKDQKLGQANNAVTKLDPSGKLREELIRTGLDTSPVVLNALARVGEMLGEDNAGSDAPGGGDFSGTRLPPAEAAARGKELLSQSMNSKNPAERRRLNQEAQKFFAMVPKTAGAKVA